ncbi:signal peptide peptidase [Aspergillus sclerotialis]|uniref:Signal peptide peptidase n=1 Tax=Aspergillus sclerotialis TaxID=2070753 RepID=A0A3A2Z632_9EURO|nr:signal peptide peptidase [Aspergillus sclerotialis]
MEEVSPLAEFLGHILYKFDHVKPILLLDAHILIAALFPIIIAAHASLSRPSSAAKPPKKDDDEAESEDDEDEPSRLSKAESFEPMDALIFPLLAGCTLSLLYLVLKWIKDPAILNKILSFYFCQVGVFFIEIFVKDALVVLRSFVFPRQYRRGGKVWKVDQSKRCVTACGNEQSNSAESRHSPLPGILSVIPLPAYLTDRLWLCRHWMYQHVKVQANVRGIQKIKFRMGLLDVVSVVVAVAVTGYFSMVSNPWYLTNFVGISFCYCALQIMSPSTFWTGSLILGSLFLYDIYFVFFTPVMVTVATKVDAPIKLLFPRPSMPWEAVTTTPSEATTTVPWEATTTTPWGATTTNPWEPEIMNWDPESMAPVPWPEDIKAPSLAMLGLGDIVLPGLVICMALRFDLFLYYKLKGTQKAKAEKEGKEFVAPQYQTATGGWGERFWSAPVRRSESELEPPYHDARTFPKTYFQVCIFGYTLGMIATFVAMSYFEHGQPALLYLVPGVLLSLWGTAWFKGDIREMWNFSDVLEGEEDGDKKDEKAKESTDFKSMFSRILSGDSSLYSLFMTPDKSHKEDEVASKKDSSGAPTEGKENDKSKNSPAGKDKGTDGDAKDVDLFSLSITIPQKAKPKKPRASLGRFKPTTCEDDPDDIYLRPERNSEPPAKRQRRSLGDMDTA